jgi:Spy/CpxP family protein refolding chaperone
MAALTPNFQTNHSKEDSMKLNKIGKFALLMTLVGLVVYAADADAGRWRSARGGACYGPGSGWGPGGPAGPEYGGELSDEEIQGLYEERRAFMEDTRELRETLYQKNMELQSELAKAEPDAGRAAAIQKEISSLRGDLDRKRIERRLEMRKKYPQLGSGGGYGRGYAYGGPGKGRGYGRGFYGGGGPGNCWR